MNELPNIICSLVIVLAVPFFRQTFFFRPPWRAGIKKAVERIQFFDILRGIAIIAVIGIHTVDFYRLELDIENTWLLLVNAFFRFAIPLFIIASGMLLDPSSLHKGSKWQFYRRKLTRIFVPYAIFTVLWSLAQSDSLSTLLLHIVRGNALAPYYFVIVLFELYLLYPLMIRLAAYRWFLYITLGVSFFAVATDFRYLLNIPLPFEYVFFFAYGIALRPLLLAPHKETVKLGPWLALAGIYFVSFFAAPAFYYNTVFFWGIAVFWIIHFGQRYLPLNLKNGFAYIGKASLWIFLLHYPILFWIGEGVMPQLLSLPSGIAVVLLIATTLVTSLFLAVLIIKTTEVSKRILHAAFPAS
jgi:surface polysaccharide O-acyltransferase-like enzyme